ncbi:MAG: ATPase [Roseburia sp.]|uniref:ATP-binding protein n=1 Tax=Roseburia sp. 831b TaxID=1261635 RepID=UPI0009518C9F|nr:ATP-binding protein [Roseburia sp. 831b]MCI5919634.1 ATPase [Roseburia sp.]MDY5883449.1 ATP-binding protein [Roseburia sp.]WVK71716.1 ATP-binding protein [Roseburia sp. 831b]
MSRENGANISWVEYENEQPQGILLDIRDNVAYQYGTVKGAIHVMPADCGQWAREQDKEVPVFVFCKTGVESVAIVEQFVEMGLTAYNLEGGYNAWLIWQVGQAEKTEKKDEIEKSIRKKFHKSIFSRFCKAINQYEMLQEGDKVAVCISGGKDSMLMAKCFQELKRHNKFQFDLVFLVMDPGYNATNRKLIEENAKIMGIPLTIFESTIFDAVYDIEKNPCYLCARMRRGYLYSKAKELGCNKIALGHHYDDVIETILMGMLYGAQVQTMMPKLHSTNFEGMELIRPLYLVREDDIKHWRDYNELHFLQCACRFTETCSSCSDEGASKSKRLEIKNLIRQMKEVNPYVEANIFKSVENVNLSTVVAYKKDGVVHNFLEDYDKK